jgi:hypothetical protein
MSNILYEKDPEKSDRVFDMFQQGATIREVCYIEGISRQTAQEYRASTLSVQEEDGLPPILCPCGRPTGHKGWCSFRLQYSPKRQALLNRWHGKKKGTS